MKTWLMGLLVLLISAVPARAQEDVTASSIYLGAAPCRVRVSAGTPTGGNNCDLAIDSSSHKLYLKVSGTWTDVSGTVPVTRGGTGLTSLTSNGVLYGNGTSNAGVTAQGGTNTVLSANSGTPFFTSTPTVTGVTATTSVTTPTVTTPAATNLTISPTGDIVLAPTGVDVLPNANYTINLGALSNKYLALHAAELWVETLVAQNTLATIGGRVLVAPTNTLTSDLPAAATSIDVKYNNFANGDRVYMEANGAVEWMAITSGASGGGAGTLAYVNRAEGYNTAATASCSTAAASHTTGNLLVLTLSRQTATSVTVSDTAGNTYHQAGSTLSGGGNVNRLDLWYAWNINGNASNVVTATLTSGTALDFMCSVRQFSGAQTSSDPLDNYASNFGNSTSVSSGTVTVTAASSVIVAMIEADGQSITAGSGYTLTGFNGGAGDGPYFADEYHIVTASEAATASVATGPWGVMAAAFKVATGGGGGPYTYSVTRNLDGSGANDWAAGDAVLDTGTTGSGFIDLYSVAGVLSGAGPTIVGNVRTGTTYSNIEPRWAIGNLNGLYGYSGATYGAAFGQPSGAWIKIDPTNGVRLGYNSTTNVQIDASGNASFAGQVTAGSGAIGGFTIGSDYLRDAANSFGLASTVSGGDDVRFWAGASFANRATAPFFVTESGEAWFGSNIGGSGGIPQGSLNFSRDTDGGLYTVGGSNKFGLYAWGISTNNSIELHNIHDLSPTPDSTAKIDIRTQGQSVFGTPDAAYITLQSAPSGGTRVAIGPVITYRQGLMGVSNERAYDAGDYTAPGGGTWTVDSGDPAFFDYTVIGDYMTVTVYLQTTDISGSPNTLSIAIPGGYTALKTVRTEWLAINAGTRLDAVITVVHDDTRILINHDTGGGPWSNSTGDNYFWGQITFPVYH